MSGTGWGWWVARQLARQLVTYLTFGGGGVGGKGFGDVIILTREYGVAKGR